MRHDRHSSPIPVIRSRVQELRERFGPQPWLTVVNGVAFLNLNFLGGSYTEKVWGEPVPTLSVASPRTSLLVTCGYNRLVSELAGKLPRCLGARSIRGSEVSRSAWGGRAEVVVRPHWETLALMPDNIADALGMERQRSLDQMPWLEVAKPVREDALRMVRQAMPASVRQAPVLRLVASS